MKEIVTNSSDGVNFLLPEPGTNRGEASVVATGGRTRLILAGDIDLQMVRELNEAIAECEARALPLDIDMRHVTFMDSAGVATFARMITANTPLTPVRLLKPPRVVRYLFDITGLMASVELLEEDPAFSDPTRWADEPPTS
ncbi:MAG: STAS domain-containing protein [Bowdeniella nasicola]|nr:STAS domain-containing protein [Bowdeniella nasicola]